MSSSEERSQEEISNKNQLESESELQRQLAQLRYVNGQQKNTLDLFYALFRASPIPIYIARFDDGQMLYVNNALLDYFEWEREDVIGHTGVELGLWPAMEEWQQFFARVQEQGRVSREERFDLPSGTRHALCSLSYVQAGGEAYVLTALVDITERVAAEARVRELASALGQAEQRERGRVAQLLHDDVQQLLYSLQLDLQMLADEVPPELSEQVQDLERRALEAIQMARSLSFELNASALESEALQDLFDWLVVVKEQRYGLQIDARLEGDIKLADKAKRQMLVQVLRELLFNVVKHAGVREAELVGRVEDDDLVVEVIDGGKGFDPEPAAQKTTDSTATSSGLNNVREQLGLFGGSLTIEPAPGGGTRCRIVLPSS
jgi:PAS domain S-box-containing protein